VCGNRRWEVGVLEGRDNLTFQLMGCGGKMKGDSTMNYSFIFLFLPFLPFEYSI
jgi:hypothetical protein